jgi:hypothetical protein
MKKFLIGILKKYKGQIILILIVILSFSWIYVRERKIINLTAKITKLEAKNYNLQDEIKSLESDYITLKRENVLIKFKNDSLKVELNRKQKELKNLIAKHEHIIDSLLNVPPDTVYMKLSYIYPNYDGSPLKYPFSESQIMPMYKTAISYPLIINEYTTQSKILSDCLDLNEGYEKSEKNLRSQIDNLKMQINLYDSQINNYQSEIQILNH